MKNEKLELPLEIIPSIVAASCLVTAGELEETEAHLQQNLMSPQNVEE
jgi:hypothetical protein